MRSILRTSAIALTVGALSVSVAWAGAGLAPVGEVTDAAQEQLDLDRAPEGEDSTDSATSATVAEDAESGEVFAEALARAAELGEGELLAGAARIDMHPRPEDYDAEWETEGCGTLGSDAGEETLTHVPDFDQSKWPAKTNCIYMGGYGIGPMNPVTEWDDEHGLHVRSVALSDGDETVVLTLIDAVYYLGRYNEMCEDCGSLDIAERLGEDEELGIDPAGVFISATHSHTAPDLIGGWGGVPEWYMQQVSDSIEDSIRQAVASLQPAVLEVGEVFARQYNAGRRNVYRSAEEPGMSWLRAVAVDDSDNGGHPSDGSRSPRAGGDEQAEDYDVIATVGAYAAHPVTRSSGSGVAHGDWPAVFAKHLEDRGSGVGMALATGLGNVSPRQLHDHGGAHLAADVPPVGSGTVVQNPTVSVAAERWQHPVTNPALTALAAPGFFDRPFEPGPATVNVGRHEARPCTSTSPVAVATQVNAARIGDLVITGAPGETFSNLSNTIKEHNPTGVTMPLGMVNDGLGYIIQSFEADDAARMGPGFFATDAGFEYEDAYSIDGCFGDQVLENTLGLLGQLNSGN